MHNKKTDNPDEMNIMTDHFEFHIDESGRFERIDDTQDKEIARMIGGVIVPPVLVNRMDEVREDLMEIGRKYDPDLQSVTDIHISEMNNAKERQQLRDEMIKYFVEKMKSARIAFIYQKRKIADLKKFDGAMLYRNMLVHLIKIIGYYHPFFQVDANIDFMLAHRRFPYPAKYEDALAGMGYIKLKDPRNGKTELTAITEEELRTIMKAVTNTLPFISQRTVSFKVRQYKDWDNPFMAMADSVCNKIGFILKTSGHEYGFRKNMIEAFGRENKILFFCAEDYEIPEAMLADYLAGRFSMFLYKYHQREKRWPYADNHLLFPAVINATQVLKNQAVHLDIDNCRTLTDLADDMLEDRRFNRLHVVGDILMILKKEIDRIKADETDEKLVRLAHDFHDAGLRHANHTANTRQGFYHRDQGVERYKKLANPTDNDVRRYHAFINRASIADANEFAFERGLARLRPVMETEEKITEILANSRNEIYGKICGSIGQNWAFLRKEENASEFFKKAAFHLGEKDIHQISYRAHLAVDSGEWETYQREICLLLDWKNFKDFREAIRMCLKDFPKTAFNLHLLLKGCLSFLDDGNQKRAILRDIRKIIYKPAALKYHPWELIFTTMGMLFEQVHDMESARKFYNFAKKGFAEKKEQQLTFIMLEHAARARSALTWLNEDQMDKVQQEIACIKKTFECLKSGNNAPGIYNPNEIEGFDGQVRSGWFDDVGKRFLSESDNAYESTLKSICEEFTERFTFNYW